MLQGDTANFGKILKDVRLARNTSQEELAERSGLDRTYISMLERGRRTPTLNTIFSLSKALNISADFFVSLLSSQYEQTKKSLVKDFLGTSLSCGKPLGLDHLINEKIDLEAVFKLQDEDIFFAYAAGDSMSPTILDKDLLVINKSAPLKDQAIILVQIENEFSIKRFAKTSTKTSLICDNPLFAAPNIEDSGFIYCGTVSQIIRSIT